MALSSNSLACFVLDGSASMARARSFPRGQGDEAYMQHVAPIDVMKQYTRAKIVQRIMRDLRTLPIVVLSYCVSKTKNHLTALAKERSGYDKDADPYRHMYENIHVDWNVGKQTLDIIDDIRAGTGPDAKVGAPLEDTADAHSALILALETIDNVERVKGKATWTREIFLLTDGEGISDWDRWEDTAERMNERGISLTVIGFNFDDDDVDFQEKNKSQVKHTNEKYLRLLVDALELPSIVATASRALDAIAMPQLATKRSQKTSFPLTFGDRERFGDRSILVHVDMKKAVSPAPALSMKRWSLAAYRRQATGLPAHLGGDEDVQMASSGPRGSKRGAGDEVGENGDTSMNSKHKRSQFEEDTHSQSLFGASQIQPSTSTGFKLQGPSDSKDPKTKNFLPPYTLGAPGLTLDTLLAKEGLAPPDDEEVGEPHPVINKTISRIKPVYDNKTPSQRRQEEEERSEMSYADRRKAEQEELKQFPVIEDTQDVYDAYLYGGSYVAAEDMGEGKGTLSGLQTGMKVVGFSKMANFRWDWRLDDVSYVHAAAGQTGSELMLSSFINALIERKCYAIVRYVGKPMTSSKTGISKHPDPKMGALWPFSENGVEYFYYVKMPFAEDVKSLTFPSLERFNLRSGKEVSEHKFLPNKSQQEAMDNLVDSMNLMTAGPPDEDGQPTEWFSCADSYSPAIHVVRSALVYRISNPEGDLPPVAAALTKYLDPPAPVRQRSAAPRAAAQKELETAPVPPKPKKVTKKAVNFGTGFDADVGAIIRGATARTTGLPDAVLQKTGSEDIIYVDDDEKVSKMDVDATQPTATLASARSDKPKSEPASSFTLKSQSAKSQTENLNLADSDGDLEPDTEDEDDSGDVISMSSGTLSSLKPPLEIPELDPAKAFEAVARAHGIEPALAKMFERVRRMVETSFSTQKYDDAAEGLQEAKRVAREMGAKASYDKQHERLAAYLRQGSKKDFVELMK